MSQPSLQSVDLLENSIGYDAASHGRERMPVPVPVDSHAYGETHLGKDPATSVGDEYLISHEARNLAILGESTFPGTTSYNPTTTIQATAWRAAERIAANFHRLAV